MSRADFVLEASALTGFAGKDTEDRKWKMYFFLGFPLTIFS